MSRTERRRWRLYSEVNPGDLTKSQLVNGANDWVEAWGSDHTCRPGCGVCGKDLNRRDRRRQRHASKAQLRKWDK